MPLIVYVLGAAIFALTTSEYMVAGLMPALAAEFGVSFAAIGYLVTFYAGAMAVGGPLLTTALLRVPRKNALLGLIALFVVGQVIGALAPGYAVMVAARLVTAVAAAAFFGVALTACAELVEGNQFGRASSLVLGGLMVGTVLGLPVATWLGEWYGWRASFFAVALVAVLVGLLVLQLMPAIPGSAGSGSLREELKVFRNAHLWWVYATSLLLIGATFAGFTYFVPILTEVSGFSASTVPLLLVVWPGDAGGQQHRRPPGRPPYHRGPGLRPAGGHRRDGGLRPVRTGSGGGGGGAGGDRPDRGVDEPGAGDPRRTGRP